MDTELGSVREQVALWGLVLGTSGGLLTAWYRSAWILASVSLGGLLATLLLYQTLRENQALKERLRDTADD
jgi:hypothetical protein